MVLLFLDFGIDFIWARLKAFDGVYLIIVQQEPRELLQDLLLHLKLLVPLHLLHLVKPSSQQPSLTLVTFVLVCLLSVHPPQDV